MTSCAKRHEHIHAVVAGLGTGIVRIVVDLADHTAADAEVADSNHMVVPGLGSLRLAALEEVEVVGNIVTAVDRTAQAQVIRNHHFVAAVAGDIRVAAQSDTAEQHRLEVVVQRRRQRVVRQEAYAGRRRSRWWTRRKMEG